MASTTRYHYLGDKSRASMYRGAGQAALAKLRDYNKYNNLQDNSLSFKYKDGTVVTAVAGYHGQEDVFITSPIVEAKAPVAPIEAGGELKRFIVIFGRGHSNYIPVDAPAGAFGPQVVTPWYAVVYDMQTKTYAKITDPVKDDADENGDIIFPCSVEKVQEWWADSEWISKQEMSRELDEDPATGGLKQKRVLSEPWKVWDETFVFYETINGHVYIWGPSKSDNSDPATCGCQNYPKKIGDHPCYGYAWHNQTGLWICMDAPRSDTGYNDYRYLKDPFYAVTGDPDAPLLSTYSCYEGGYCAITGGSADSGFGSQGSTSGEHVTDVGSDIMVSITPTTIFGGPSFLFDYNALGYGYFGAALLTCSYKKEIISSYFHERNSNRHTDDTSFREVKLWQDKGDINYLWLAGAWAHYRKGSWNSPGSYELIIESTLHTPLGTADSAIEGQESSYSDSGYTQDKAWGNYPPYGAAAGGGHVDTSQFDSYSRQHFIPDIAKGDLNVFNCYRRYYSLTTKSQEVLFQFYLWHYMIVDFINTASGHTATSATTTRSVSHSWDYTLIAQAEFMNKELPNPLVMEDYLKYDELLNANPSFDRTAFTFNTPELETEINELIEKIYSDLNTPAKVLTGETVPLVFEFEPYIVETGEDESAGDLCAIERFGDA